MRGVLILGGFLLAGVVALVVAWPRLVDEPAIRAEMQRLLHAAASRQEDLGFQGAVRLELLPLPRVTIERLVLGDRAAADAEVRFEADRVDVDIAALALLAGRVEPRRVQLVRPRLRLAEPPPAPGATLAHILAVDGLAGLNRLSIVDGSLELADAPSRSVWPASVAAIDLELTAEEQRRRFRFQGSASVAGEPVRLILEGGPLAADEPVGLELELASGGDDAAAKLAFRGNLRPGAGRLEGTLQLNAPSGQLPRLLARPSEDPVSAPVELRARVALSASALALTDLELAVAGQELGGSFELAFGADPRFGLDLAGHEIAVTPELELALRVAGRVIELPRGLRGRATLRAATITWRDDQIRRLRAELSLEPGRRIDLRRLEATLPGQTALAWTGAGPGTDDEGPLQGSVSVQAGELRRLLRWLGADPADLPAGGLSTLDLAASAALGAGRVVLRELSARLDATQLAGSLVATVDARPRLDLALAADRVNTALYLGRAPERPAVDAWQDRLAAVDGTVDLTVERISHDALRADGLQLKAGLANGRVTVDELAFGGPGEARFGLRGAADLGARTYEFQGELDLPQPKLLLRLAGVAPPPELDRLAPVRFAGTLRGDPDVAAAGVELTAAGATASVAGTVREPFGARSPDLVALLTAAETSDLLEALGWPAPPNRPSLGPLDARLEFRHEGGPAEIGLQGAIGESELSGQLALAVGGPRPRVTGEVRAGRLDTDLVAAVFGTLAPRLAFPAGSPSLWPGAWPRQPLGWGWLDAVDLQLELEATRFRQGGRTQRGARARAALEDGRLAVSQIASPLADGTLDGTVTLEHEGGYATLGADLRLSGARAGAVAATLAPGSGLEGRLDLRAELLAQGRSIADMVRSLRGEGELALRDGRLPGVALEPKPGAATPTIDIVELSGPFRIEDGVATSSGPGLALTHPAGDAEVQLRFDLLAWLAELRLDGGVAASPRERAPSVRLIGAPGRLREVPAAP